MKILAGLLRSPEGRAALEAAAAEARLRKATLVLVRHVSASEDAPFEVGDGASLEDRCRNEGIEVKVLTPRYSRSAAESILRSAEEEGADLIVIGLRRRSRVGKFVLGSNSADILLRADTPVLAVKPDES